MPPTCEDQAAGLRPAPDYGRSWNQVNVAMDGSRSPLNLFMVTHHKCCVALVVCLGEGSPPIAGRSSGRHLIHLFPHVSAGSV